MPRFELILPAPLLKALRAESQRTGLSVAELIRQALAARYLPAK